MQAARCVGALMAGGGATRFGGVPKGLALIGDIRIADRAMSALQSATDRQIVVANDPRATTWFSGARVVPDDAPGLGPLGGLCTALREADGASLIVVAWDMPFVSGALLAALRAMGESGAMAVAPLSGATAAPEPLCTFYGAGALDVCERLIAEGERRAGALFDALVGARGMSAVELAAFGEPSHLLRSVDTQDELLALGGRLPTDEEMARR